MKFLGYPRDHVHMALLKRRHQRACTDPLCPHAPITVEGEVLDLFEEQLAIERWRALHLPATHFCHTFEHRVPKKDARPKARRRRNNERLTKGRVRHPRPLISEQGHIAEELYHRRELDDLEAIATDGYDQQYPTPHVSASVQPKAHEEAPMPTGELFHVRPGSSRKRGFPARTGRPTPGELHTGSDLLDRLWGRGPEQTLAVDPTESVNGWAIEDLIEDRREYLEVGP